MKTMFKPVKVHSVVILVLSFYNGHAIYKKYKWGTLAVTVTIWPGHTDLMVDRFIVGGS